MNISRQAWVHESAPAEVEKLTYQSAEDGVHDWALAWRPPCDGKSWVVSLHGHGSSGDQLFTRADLKEMWLSRYRASGLGVLSPN
ncbi:MAG: hypothetical protein WCL16_02720, partial [bacterium]